MYTKELFSTLLIILSTVNGDNRSVCDLRDKIELNCCCNKLNATSVSIDCDVSDTVSEITPATWLLFRNIKENITEFYLRGNIMVITVSMMEFFNQLTELRTIQFLNTKITKIPENTFSKQKKISELFLSFNRIDVINANTVSALPLLKILSLSNNNVKTISVNAFIQLPQLLELHLHSNKLTVLPAHIFDELKNLKILTLHNNLLVKFEREILLPIIMNFYHPDSGFWLQGELVYIFLKCFRLD